MPRVAILWMRSPNSDCTVRTPPVLPLYIGLLPLIVVNPWSPDKELLHGITGVCLFHNHDPRAKEDTVERHRLYAVLESLLPSDVGSNALPISLNPDPATSDMLGWDQIELYHRAH